MNTSDQKNHTSNQHELTTDMDMGTFKKLLNDNLNNQVHLPKSTIDRIAMETFTYTWQNELCRTPTIIINFIRARLEELKDLN